MSSYRLFLSSLLVLSLSACSEHALLPVEAGYGPNPALPEPNKTLIPTVNVATAVGWPENGRPSPAAGLVVHAFARGLDHPRWLYVLPNGDVLVAETNAPPKPEKKKSIKSWFTDKAMERAGAGVPSANRISLLRDSDRDGVADVQTPFLENLNSPFGMALVGDQLYVANTDAVVRFPYRAGQTRINVQGEKVMDLPGGPINHHWTKNLIASPDGRKLYVTSGSNSNVGENDLENEAGRAAIWEHDLATGQSRIFASGLRNPNGLDWEPRTGALWTAVNERDEIGSDLVPDYVTSVQDGGFYGWPYSYYGQNVDKRVKPARPDLVAKALVPDYALGAHTASLGISFAEGSALPRFSEGLFVAQHGSWNRKPHSGYKVIFIPFADGKPNGQPIDVLTGFLNEKQEAMGRPVDVLLDSQGALLVTDDVGNTVWRVSLETRTPSSP
ncbi:PQQ-dependent sugar dehydrogenase [Pseudomonas sp. B392_1p]|uniref:PQQ-dependent sugar dehydrogenase n=1 Tax=Pseudomonas sp. B392_1p TaxID=3457507 RepID=UPI003FD57BB5